MSAIAALAELGRLARVAGFAEAKPSGNKIEDPEILGDLLDLLSQEIGRIDKVTDVNFNPDTDTFKGKAEQRVGLGRNQVYQFDLSPDGMNYKMINAADMAEFADSDEGFLEILDYAAKGGKKLNCKAGNMQCGGKCQNGKQNCYHGMTPEQKKEAQSLAAKAKKAIVEPSAVEESKSALENLGDKKNKESKTESENNRKAGLSGYNVDDPGLQKELDTAAGIKDVDALKKALVNKSVSTDIALMRADELGADARQELEKVLFQAKPDEIKAIAEGRTNEKPNRSKDDELADELGSAVKIRTGAKISNQADFDADFERAYNSISEEIYPHYDGLIPIIAIRRAFGDRTTKDEFDQFIRGQLGRGYQLIGGEAASNRYYSSKDLNDEGISSKIAGSRFYIKRERERAGN